MFEKCSIQVFFCFCFFFVCLFLSLIFSFHFVQCVRAVYLTQPGNHIDVITGKWIAHDFSTGNYIDSFLEYLVKGGVLLGRGELIDMFRSRCLSLKEKIIIINLIILYYMILFVFASFPFFFLYQPC